MDLVSVIIPTYNRAHYITDALDSVWAQSYRPVEVIVVDDGSTDDTQAVVDEWRRSHQEDGFSFTYRYQKNAGAPVARNHGLRVASGGWIKFLDSDDVLHPDALETQVEPSKELSENEIVFGDLGVMDRSGLSRTPEYYEPPGEDEETFEYLIGHIVNTPTPLHRPSLLATVEGFREDVQKGQEYDLHLRLAVSGVRFVYQRGMVAYKRKGDEGNSVTAKNSISENPDAHVFMQDNRAELAQRYYEGEISERVSRMLATGYWITGRQLVRARYRKRARYCFKNAAAYAVDTDHIVGPAPYRWLARGVGPIRAERVLSLVKRLLGR
jgi:glycosyltransferase involved in cell wall biosynthesis